MSIDLQYILDTASVAERAILTVFKATLDYEADTSLAAAKLAEDVKFVCRAEDAKVASRTEGSKVGLEGSLFTVWWLLLDIARCTPSGHPWQDRLVQAVEILRQTEGVAPGAGVSKWSVLPNLDLCLLDRWDIIQDPEAEDPITDTELEEWKHQNSFVARLTSPSFAPWMNFPLKELQEALERPLLTKKMRETHLWVACEWILRCGEVIFEYIQPENGMGEFLDTGELYDSEASPEGLPRWNFWKDRFQEISADAERLEISPSIMDRMSEAVKKMDELTIKMTVAPEKAPDV